MTVDTFSLAGKTAIVTGSGRENGIGAAIARALARNGADVAIHYVSDASKPRAEKVAADLAKEFGVKTTVVSGRLEDPAVSPKLVLDTLAGLKTDHIDILVNNAGDGSFETILNAGQEALQRDFGINVFGPFYLTKAAVQEGKMPKGGRIINVGSIASRLGSNSAATYAAAKAAQDSFTTSWAAELGKSRGITVNSVAPGPVLTDLAKPLLENEDEQAKAMVAGMVAQTRAADRLGTTEDVADAVLLLAQEKSRWITAQWISVSGGITGAI